MAGEPFGRAATAVAGDVSGRMCVTGLCFQVHGCVETGCTSVGLYVVMLAPVDGEPSCQAATAMAGESSGRMGFTGLFGQVHGCVETASTSVGLYAVMLFKVA